MLVGSGRTHSPGPDRRTRRWHAGIAALILLVVIAGSLQILPADPLAPEPAGVTGSGVAAPAGTSANPLPEQVQRPG